MSSLMPGRALQIGPPEASEYAAYYGRYIALVSTDDILEALEQQARETQDFLSGFSETQGNYRYAPDKWSVKEVLGHIIDTERIFAYRALRIARNDSTPLPGYEQDHYVRHSGSEARRLEDLIEEFACVRRGSQLLFQQFDHEAWMRRGIADQKEISVRAIAYILAGHELHHRQVLREKYLPEPNRF